jgi:hypothetical protein
MVDRLSVFPDPASWSAWRRRALLALPDQDAVLLLRELDPIASAPAEHLSAYLDRQR